MSSPDDYTYDEHWAKTDNHQGYALYQRVIWKAEEGEPEFERVELPSVEQVTALAIQHPNETTLLVDLSADELGGYIG